MTTSNDPKLCQRPRVPLNFEYQRRGMERLHSFRHCCVSVFFVLFVFFIIDPFPLTLWSSGGGGVGSLCAWLELTVHLIRAWNVLVVYSCFPSATVATSSNMDWIFFFLFIMCCIFFLSSFFSFFLTGWWLAKPHGSSSFFLATAAFHSHISEYFNMAVTLVQPQTEHDIEKHPVHFEAWLDFGLRLVGWLVCFRLAVKDFIAI